MSETVENGVSEIATTPAAVVDAAVADSKNGATPEEIPGGRAAEDPAKLEARRVAERFEKAKRYEIRMRARDEQLSNKEQDLSRKSAELEAKLKKIEERMADADLYEQNPVEWAARRKTDPDLLAQRMLRPVTEEQREIQALKARLEAFEKGTQEQREAQTKQAQEQTLFEQKQHLVRTFTPDTHPNVTGFFEPHEVPDQIDRFLSQPTTVELDDGSVKETTVIRAFHWMNGRYPTYQEVADAFEQSMGQRIAKLNKKPEVDPSQTPSSQVTEEPSKKAPGTLTNNHAAQAASGQTLNGKSRQDRKREVMRQLEAEDQLIKRS